MHSQHYTLAYLPGLYLAGLFDSERRFLNNLRKNQVPLIAIASGQFLHVLASYLLVIRWGLGIQGTGLASGLTNGCVFLITVAYANSLEEVK